VSWNNKADRFDSLQEHEMVNRYEEDDQPNALSVFVTPDVRRGRHLFAETGFERGPFNVLPRRASAMRNRGPVGEHPGAAMI